MADGEWHEIQPCFWGFALEIMEKGHTPFNGIHKQAKFLTPEKDVLIQWDNYGCGHIIKHIPPKKFMCFTFWGQAPFISTPH